MIVKVNNLHGKFSSGKTSIISLTWISTFWNQSSLNIWELELLLQKKKYSWSKRSIILKANFLTQKIHWTRNKKILSFVQVSLLAGILWKTSSGIKFMCEAFSNWSTVWSNLEIIFMAIDPDSTQFYFTLRNLI